MKKRIIIVLIILFVVIVSIAAAVYFTGNYCTEKYTFATVRFENADGSVTSERVTKGSDVLFPDGADFEGYNFLGWVDENGNILPGDSITVWRDQTLTTLYTVALGSEEHNAYIFPDSDGLLFVNVPFTKAEAAQMIASIIAVPVEAKGNFIDIDRKADYAKAASILYTLQIVNDNRLHPDEYITRGELISMLASFYPQTAENYEFKDVHDGDYNYRAYCTAASLGWIDCGNDKKLNPHEEITKLEAITLINKITGRHISPNANLKKFSGIISDLSLEDEGFADAVEAAVTHTYKTDSKGELFIKYERNIPEKTGFILRGTSLRYLDENGCLVKGKTVDGFEFDENGFYTSGSPELDELVHNVLENTISDDMTQTEMLRALYDYMTHNFAYKKKTLYKAEDSSWYNDAAYEMLSQMEGNCYSFTASYYSLVRAIGVKAVIHTGHVGDSFAVHCWPTIFVDDVEYLCDPELEYASLYRSNRKVDLFMQDLSCLAKWKYQEYIVRK